MSLKQIYQFNTELHKVTGIQRVLLDIHTALKGDFDTKIVGTTPYNEVNVNLGISENDYLQFRNPFLFRDSLVIIHERRLMPLMWLLTHIPGLGVKCLYIHHNELYGHKRLSLFPKHIVAISDAGIKNLTDYFGISNKVITKIHNCVKETDSYLPRIKKFDPNDITILYPARINNVKRQLEIVKYLKGKLDPRIKILFAGTGPLYDELKEECNNEEQFQVLGFRSDIPELMRRSDFMMLFSTQEGLPISLIEAIQTGLPVICNNVGGNTEIVSMGENGFVVNEWDSLLSTLNNLPNLTQEEMNRMRKNSKEKYSKFFTFEIFKSKYTNLINRIYANT